MDHAPTPDLDPRDLRRLDGFGLATPADAYLRRPHRVEAVADVLAEARSKGRRVVLRGAGRSYGDPSVRGEAIGLDLARMDRILDWDPVTGLLDVEGGATFREIFRRVLPDGGGLAVVAGTLLASVAGGTMVNLHGKNNPRAGTLADRIEEFDAMSPDGFLHTVRKGDPAFEAIVGSLGLLAVVTRVRLRLDRWSSGRVRVLTRRTRDWDETFAAFADLAAMEHRVAWIDPFHPSGRGAVQGADHVREDDPRSLDPDVQFGPPSPLKALLPTALNRVLNREDLAPLTAFRWRATRDGTSLPTFHAFNFPLDSIPDWNRAYLPDALVQFQAALPDGVAQRLFPEILEECRHEKREPFLAVLKRHRPNGGALPYLLDGWSIALDFRRGPWNERPLNDLLRRLADRCLAAGGKFYPAKDAILDASQWERSFGEERVANFRRLKTAWDPGGLLVSDFAVRAGLADV